MRLHTILKHKPVERVEQLLHHHTVLVLQVVSVQQHNVVNDIIVAQLCSHLDCALLVQRNTARDTA